MNIFSALLTGIRDVNRSKRYIFCVFFMNLILALVLALALGETIRSSLGSSIAAENMRHGFDGLWFNSFTAQASGLASTFNPGVTHIGAVFNGLDAFLAGDLLGEYPGIIGVGIVYLLLWTFFSGGFIAIYVGKEEHKSFFASAARFFPRFFILALLAGALYFLIFFFVMEWLSDWVNELTRETIDERIHFAYTGVKYIVVWFLVWIVNMLFDYSKIVAVIQDHKNFLIAPFKAILKALITVFPRFHRTFGLYGTIGIGWIILMLLYWLIAPGAGVSTWTTIILAFLLGQLYILSRIWIRCLFYSGQTAMCKAIAGTE